MGSASKDDVKSVLMLPWLAHGHISPFLELAKKFADKGMVIHFCSVNLGSIRPKLPPKYSETFNFVELRLPSLPDLSPRLHTTKSLPPSLMSTLKAAFDMSAPKFEEILRSLRPDLLVYDFLQQWAPAAAATLNIPAVEFLCTSVTMCAFTSHANKDTGVEFPYPGIYLHDHEVGQFAKLLESSANNVKDMSRFEECLERSAGIVLIKSFREIEGKYIDYLSLLLNQRLVTVGPLVEEDICIDRQGSELVDWLGGKEQSSTVFVSFGSEYFLSREEMVELAHGLELSKVNFIWVVRFPDGNGNAVRRCLPYGFIKRVRGRGLVVEGWAPQVEILQHPSIGGFISHCGWSSVMESLKFGVPIIAMPMQLDQPVNARLVEEIGVGMEAKRDNNGKIQSTEVARTIRNVMVGEVGNSVRSKSRELKSFLCKNNEAERDSHGSHLRFLASVGKPAHQSVILVKFFGTFSGIESARRLHKYFADNKRGKPEFMRMTSRKGDDSSHHGHCHAASQAIQGNEFEETILFGYMGVADDTDRLDFGTKKLVLLKSRREIQDLANGPVKAEAK